MKRVILALGFLIFGLCISEAYAAGPSETYAYSVRRAVLEDDEHRVRLWVRKEFSPGVQSYTVRIRGLRFDEETAGTYDIYIGLPKGMDPDVNSPYYAGILSLFSMPQNGTFDLDITNTIQHLLSEGKLNGRRITVTFVRGGQTGTGISFRSVVIRGEKTD
jgi:hypothetical protein